MALAYSVASQLHFVSFVGYPIVAFLFWIKYFPKKINWKYWVGVVFISDVYTQGDNLNQFIYAVTAKTDGGDASLKEKIRQISITFSMFVTSFGHKDSFISARGGALLIFLGLSSGGYLWKTRKKKKTFLYLILIWFLVFAALQLKTDTSLKPRFFMPIAAIPFIFLGLIYTVLDKFKNIIIAGFILFSFFLVLLLNYTGIKIAYDYFKTQDEDGINRQIFIKQDDAKVLEQHKLATKYMATEAQKSGKIACFYSSAQYERTYEFLFEVYYPEIKFDRISKAIKDKTACQYFSIITTDNDKLIGNNYKGYFDFPSSETFGRIQVWNAIPKESFINYDRSEDLTRKENQIAEEKTDEDIAKELEKSLKEAFKEVDTEEDEEIKAPDRLERVLWRDVFVLWKK